jgi:hypothetical protein
LIEGRKKFAGWGGPVIIVVFGNRVRSTVFVFIDESNLNLSIKELFLSAMDCVVLIDHQFLLDVMCTPI